MSPKVLELVLLHERFPGNYEAKLLYIPTRSSPFVVKVYHPGSDWLHRYQCGSLRKAMKFVDVTLVSEISQELTNAT